MKLKSILIFLVIFFFYSTQLTFAQDYKNEVGAISDNDVYIAFKQDRYYTNGFFLNFKHALNQQTLNSNLNKTTLEFELGQKIYTPYYGQAPNPSLHDRPFTGYLYGGVTYNRFRQDEQLFKYNLQAGATGKSALGEETQESFHKLLGIYKISGWEYQLKGEYSLNFNFEYNKLLFRNNAHNFDITGTGSLSAGNVFSNANAGAMIRLGKINPLYASASFNSRVSNNAKAADQNVKREFFLFIKPLINYVAYDSSIQGGLFLDDKGPVTFNPKRLVYSEQLGLTFASNRWTANYTVIFKSKEVQSIAVAYYYGSMALSYRFDKN